MRRMVVVFREESSGKRALSPGLLTSERRFADLTAERTGFERVVVVGGLVDDASQWATLAPRYLAPPSYFDQMTLNSKPKPFVLRQALASKVLS